MSGRSAVLPLLLAALILPVQGVALSDSGGDVKSHVSARAVTDFEVTTIEFSSASSSLPIWQQPDGELAEYIVRDETLTITVRITQLGIGAQGQYADYYVNVTHPVGISLAEFSANVTLTGGEAKQESFTYVPNYSHSVLSPEGALSGGLLVSVEIDSGVGIDEDPSNDVLSREIPVAVIDDPLDEGWCSDVDGDGVINCPNPPNLGLIWLTAGYDSDGTLSTDPDDAGHWRLDYSNTTSAVGDSHWRISGNSQLDYASGRIDRLHLGFRAADTACSDTGHGLGAGSLDTQISTVHDAFMCGAVVRGYQFYSMQLVTNARGAMGQGDSVTLQAVSGLDVKELNFTNMTLPSNDSWEQVIWDMSDVHAQQEYRLSYLFRSDGTSATPGIEIDGFLLFAIQKIPEYTISVDCAGDYKEGIEAHPVIPVGDPIELACGITNNGYVDITLRIYSEVTNSSWPDLIRIDTPGTNDKDSFIVTKIIKAQTTMPAWFNLSIPASVTVESLEWHIHINDGLTNASKLELGEPIVQYVDVQPSYSGFIDLDFNPSGGNPHLQLYPGDSGSVPLTFSNTGNQIGSWNLGGVYLDEPNWDPSTLIRWSNETGATIETIFTSIGDEIDLIPHVSVPEDAIPGIYDLRLDVNGKAPNNFPADRVLRIEVLNKFELEIIPEFRERTIPADNASRIVELVIINNGNSEEAYDLFVTADPSLRARLSTPSTLGIDPFGGDTSVLLLLPMPYGVDNETYLLRVTARSQSNPLYEVQTTMTLTVPSTQLVEVAELDMSDEVYRGGDEPRTLRWEVWNRGNQMDRYRLSFDHLTDVTVESGEDGDLTPWIPAGSSYNVTVSYSFDSDTFGERVVSMVAKSDLAAQRNVVVEDSGSAVFDVGSVGWLQIFPEQAMTTISEEGSYDLFFSIRNLHPSYEQLVRADIDRQSDLFFNVFDARVDTSDRDFVLGSDETRLVKVTLVIDEDNLRNLEDNSMLFALTLLVDTDIDKTSSSTPLTMLKSNPVDEGPNVEEIGLTLGNYLLIAVGVIGALAILFTAVRIVRGAGGPMEEYTNFEPLGLPPDLPIHDHIANSALGGAQEIFSQPTNLPSEPEDQE
tara:strand:+ start:4945 stop:8232 length:3288 start_codon:yes stop_codon:yes gene_type:complete